MPARWPWLASMLWTGAMTLSLACGGKFLVSGDGDAARFRHRELGYEIAYPSVLTEPGWSLVEVEGSDLFVRHIDGSAWALASHCRATTAQPRTLAAELARAIGGESVGTGQAVTHAGLDGWSGRYVRRENGQQIEIKTVTLRGARCTFDWVFMTPGSSRVEALEPRFDDWWQSFEPGPRDQRTEARE